MLEQPITSEQVLRYLADKGFTAEVQWEGSSLLYLQVKPKEREEILKILSGHRARRCHGDDLIAILKLSDEEQAREELKSRILHLKHELGQPLVFYWTDKNGSGMEF